ncbi:hypothetical protein AgCh_006257 [Apium graveolens]
MEISLNLCDYDAQFSLVVRNKGEFLSGIDIATVAGLQAGEKNSYDRVNPCSTHDPKIKGGVCGKAQQQPWREYGKQLELWRKEHHQGQPSEARGQSPPYIRGLASIPEDREFSGPYTERDSESSDDEVAPRRRRPGKEPMADGRQRPQSTQGANPQEVQERIRAHEAEIQRLRRDLEAHQANIPQIPPRGRNPPPVIDLDGPVRRRAIVPRTDPSNLLPLGDPDDLTPPFTEEIMNAHIS